VGGLTWSQERPDGSSIGGPVSVIYNGETLPLQLALLGQTQKSHMETEQRLDTQRRASLSGILRAKREPCDQMVEVIKNSVSSFTVTCEVAGRRVRYFEGVSGLE
jgi:hypothetical protein